VEELRPRVPFIGWPRQWVHEDYGFMWFTDQPGALVTQCLRDHATVAGINALHDYFDEVLRLGLIEGRTDVVIIHDWRLIRSIEPGAREQWQKRSNRPGKPMANIAASNIAVQASGVVRMAIQTGALAVQLATGQKPIKMIEDPATALEKFGVRAPARELYENLRRASGSFRLR